MKESKRARRLRYLYLALAIITFLGTLTFLYQALALGNTFPY